jgi:hypothetical protein
MRSGCRSTAVLLSEAVLLSVASIMNQTEGVERKKKKPFIRNVGNKTDH